MTETENLLKRMDDARKRKGWSEKYLGQRIAANPYIMQRLKNGGSITLRTKERIETFLEELEAAE